MTPEEEGAIVSSAIWFTEEIDDVKNNPWLIAALVSHVSRDVNATNDQVREVLKKSFFN